MTMQCDIARQRMLEYIDGELNPVAAAEVALHINSCPACALELASLRATAARLEDALGKTEAPPGLVDATMAQLDRAAFRMRAEQDATRRLRPFRAAALAAASVVLALAGLSLIAPPAYAMVITQVARLGSQATAIAAARIPAWGQLLKVTDGLRALFGF